MSLEKMKINLEYERVRTARLEMEYRAAEFGAKIAELESQIKIQKSKEDELKAKVEATE